METVKKYAVIGLSIALVLLAGYLVYVESELDNTKIRLDLANKNIDSLNASIERAKREQKTINDIDKEYQEKLKDAKTEYDKLRDSVNNNVKRVYVKADCPALPTTSVTNGRINAETAQLHPDAREDYFRLRLEIQQTIDQVKGLQDYINNVCLK